MEANSRGDFRDARPRMKCYKDRGGGEPKRGAISMPSGILWLATSASVDIKHPSVEKQGGEEVVVTSVEYSQKNLALEERSKTGWQSVGKNCSNGVLHRICRSG